jgi:hypothetical protein
MTFKCLKANKVMILWILDTNSDELKFFYIFFTLSVFFNYLFIVYIFFICIFSDFFKVENVL